jgi:hypothetical protein
VAESTEGPTDGGLTPAPSDAVTTESPIAHTGTGKIVIALLYGIVLQLLLISTGSRGWDLL